MSLINTTVKPFHATAFANGEFVEVSDAELQAFAERLQLSKTELEHACARLEAMNGRLHERSSELDLFITPILNRVRQGHSPRTLYACIARFQALACGRDPSPWRPLRETPRGASGALPDSPARSPHRNPRFPTAPRYCLQNRRSRDRPPHPDGRW